MAEENKNKSHLPYLAPLARVIPLVYDQSISYYEFLNRLYQAVDEALETMDAAIEAAEKVDQKLEGFRVELRELKADIEHRMTLAEQKVDGFDGRMRFIEQNNIELNEALIEQKEYLLGEIVKNAQVLIDFRRAYQSTFQNVKHELGGSYDFADVYHPNLLESPKLYKGPGTLSEEKGDIPALAQFIGGLGDRLDTEINEDIIPRLESMEDITSGLNAPFWKNSGLVVDVNTGELTSQVYTIETTYGQLKNKEFMLYIDGGAATQYVANGFMKFKAQIGEYESAEYNLAKAASSQVSAGYQRFPSLHLTFMQVQNIGVAVYTEAGIAQSNGGIYNGIRRISSNPNVFPNDDTTVKLTITMPIYDPTGEPITKILLEKSIVR